MKQNTLTAAVVFVGLSVIAVGVMAFEPAPGDAVEVREGDVWSPAEFITKEGRRLQIRYDDGTEEWITADRMRAVGEAGDVAASEPERERPRRFRKGQDVEFKQRSRWVDAEIKRASHPLYLVATKDGLGSREFHWEWVDPDRLRNPGEDHEGPDVFSQFGQSVHNDSIRDSLSKAKKAYADHERKQEQTARDETGKRDPFAPPPFKHPVSDADRSGLRNVRVAAVGWDRPLVDPADETIPRDRWIELRSGNNGFFEKPSGLSVSGSAVLVVIEDTPPGKATTLYAEKLDLARGLLRGAVEFDAASRPIAISPDRQRVAAVANGFHAGSKQRLDLWDWSGRLPKHVVSFKPFATSQGFQADVASAVFADPDTVIVRSRGGVISAWDAATGRGLWEAEGLDRSGTAWALSPGGEFMAVVADDHVHLLDTRTGEVRGSLPDADFRADTLSFSADGQTLVARGRERIKAWDLQNRNSWPSIALRPGRGGPLLALDDGLAWAGGWVFDVATGRPVWALEVDRLGGQTQWASAPGAMLGLSKDANKRQDSGPAFVLAAWPIPGASDPRLAGPMERARTSGSAQLLLERGGAVAIDLSRLEADASQRAAIRQVMVKQLQARGVAIVDDAPVKLVGVTTTASEQRVYESSGGAPWNREQAEVNVQTKTTRLAIEVDGQPAWAWVTTTSPGSFVTREEGQSIQQAVDASAARHDASGFLTQLQLPARIPDPRQGPEQTTRFSAE